MEQVISGTGNTASINWTGGHGTITFSEITTGMNLPRVAPVPPATQETPTVPGVAGI